MKYIIREGTVRGQGRYRTFEAGAGRSGHFWDYGDPVIYEDRDLAHKAAVAVGGRVVRLTSRAERARQRLLGIEEQAKRVARAELWLKWARASAHAETDEDAWHGAIVSAADALRAERRKLAEMVGET